MYQKKLKEVLQGCEIALLSQFLFLVRVMVNVVKYYAMSFCQFREGLVFHEMDIDHIALDPPQSQKACTVFVFSEFSYYHHLVHCAPSPQSKTVNEERKTCVVFFEDQTRTGSLNCICR